MSDYSIESNTLLIIRVPGIEEEELNFLKDLGFKIEIYEPGPIALTEKEVIECITILALQFPMNVVYELIKDQAKERFISLMKNIFGIWDKHKDSKPCILRSGEEPEFKKPKIVVNLSISKDEFATLEITNDVPNKLTEETVRNFMEVLKLLVNNRIKEANQINKLKLSLKTINRKGFQK